MDDLFVPAIQGEDSHLYNVFFNPAKKVSKWVIDSSVILEGSIFEKLLRKVERYFTKTYKDASSMKIYIKYLGKGNPLNVSDSKTSVMLGIFLAAAIEIAGLRVKNDWQSITATGTFAPDTDGNLSLEKIEVPEKKFKAFEEYADNHDPKGKHHLFLYIDDDKDLEKFNDNRKRVKSFDPLKDTLFDILDYVFAPSILPNSNILLSLKEKVFECFYKETEYIKQKHIKSSIFSISSDKFKKKEHLLIYSDDNLNDDRKSNLAFQLAQRMFLTGGIDAPIWIKSERKGKNNEKKIMPREIRGSLESLFGKEEAFITGYLSENPFLIIIDDIPYKYDELNDFLGRMELFCNSIKKKSHIIFIGKTNYDSTKINWIKPFPMPQEIPNTEISTKQQSVSVPESASNKQMSDVVCDADEINLNTESNSIINYISIGWELSHYRLYGNVKESMSKIETLVVSDNLEISLKDKKNTLIKKILCFYKKDNLIKYDSVLIGIMAHIAKNCLAMENNKEDNALERMSDCFHLMGENIISIENKTEIFLKLVESQLYYDSAETFYFQIMEFITISIEKDKKFSPDPTPLTAGQWESGNITDFVTENWYSFFVEKGKLYYLWLSDYLSDTNKIAYASIEVFSDLWDPISTKNNNKDGLLTKDDTGSIIRSPEQFNAPTTGMVYIRIDCPFLDNTGTYGIVYSTDRTRPVWKPKSDSTPLTLGKWETGRITDYLDDENWYSFHVIKGKVYNLWLNDRQSGRGEDCEVSASVFSSNTDSNFSETDHTDFFFRYHIDNNSTYDLCFKARSTGKVYIKVIAFNSGTYDIVYSTDIAKPVWKPDSKQLKYRIWEPIVIIDSVKINWYSFYVNEGEDYYIWINNWIHGGDDAVDVCVGKVNAYHNGSFFFSDTLSYDHPMSFTAPTTGMVYINVYADAGIYRIIYSTTSTRPD
jgi:hypothetical protein